MSSKGSAGGIRTERCGQTSPRRIRSSPPRTLLWMAIVLSTFSHASTSEDMTAVGAPSSISESVIKALGLVKHIEGVISDAPSYQITLLARRRLSWQKDHELDLLSPQLRITSRTLPP